MIISLTWDILLARKSDPLENVQGLIFFYSYCREIGGVNVKWKFTKNNSIHVILHGFYILPIHSPVDVIKNSCLIKFVMTFMLYAFRY